MRKKSPRAPSIALDEAIEKAVKVYDKERRHPAPVEAVAQDIGYKSANNGAALSALASLRYYGLLERPQEGQLAVTKDVEAYQFAPSEDMRRDLLLRWLKSPPLFSELLEKYHGGLPSDATLRFDLIQRGFNPVAAESAMSVFKRSVEFVRYFEPTQPMAASLRPSTIAESVPDSGKQPDAEQRIGSSESAEEIGEAPPATNVDRIPVRLPGGRRAWLLIPTPFYTADKKRLKAQIDLLLTEDDPQEVL